MYIAWVWVRVRVMRMWVWVCVPNVLEGSAILL